MAYSAEKSPVRTNTELFHAEKVLASTELCLISFKDELLGGKDVASASVPSDSW
jgi:hypothetical protein